MLRVHAQEVQLVNQLVVLVCVGRAAAGTKVRLSLLFVVQHALRHFLDSVFDLQFDGLELLDLPESHSLLHESVGRSC